MSISPGGLAFGAWRVQIACKTLVRPRMKCSGLNWSVGGTNRALWVRYAG